LVARFFEKYPDYADKAFLSVKVSIEVLYLNTPLLTSSSQGALGPGLKPDCS
jgi:hypothetical protein